MAESNVAGRIEDQAQQQTGQQQVQLRIDEHTMRTSYANAFRANGTAEEIMLDFGVNLLNPAAKGQAEIVFQVTDRIIMNHFSAKRLALALGQIIHRHEEQFGVLELEVSKRQQAKKA